MFKNSDYASLDAVIRQLLPRELHVAGFDEAATQMADLPRIDSKEAAQKASTSFYEAVDLIGEEWRAALDTDPRFENFGHLLHVAINILERLADHDAAEVTPRVS